MHRRWFAVTFAGDLFILILFAWIGRMNHHESISLGKVLYTACPFLIGWALTSLAARRGLASQMGTARGMLLRLACRWAVACAVGMVLRHFAFREGDAVDFIIVTLLFNYILLALWHLAIRTVRRRSSLALTKA